ncbi:HEPN domain-containing protein [Spirosoma sp. RP8]|uniref:HEPN domain-containing protein n=1 Tax=Spirosoma liriopis TaxID=2937440 RepID=A0ABT0HUM9_9BACT|nr:HEPN domain-containing protein [Spirosoma liriopis]MCK8495902.1 HEPN domain-containing protein [Spirosoma liriopis]
MKVEYLIVSPQDGNFCNSEYTFNNLIQTSDEITITGSKLVFGNSEDSLELNYIIETEIIKDKSQRYFHVTFDLSNEKKIELFTTFLRSFRKAVEKLHDKVMISALRDEISVHYITEAYPLINSIENLMRYVILKFMLINVGMEWTKVAMPSGLRDKFDNKSTRNNSENKLENYLYNADFSQLSEFLFSSYREMEISQLDNILNSKDSTSLTIDEIKKKILPKSNWDRYFSELINYNSKKLAEQWEQLNLLRIKVAHNKDFTKSDLDKVKSLTEEVKEKLDEAINSLSKIKLDEHQKQVIINNSLVASSQSSDDSNLKAFGLEWYLNTYRDYISHAGPLADGFDPELNYLIGFKVKADVCLAIICLGEHHLDGLSKKISANYTLDNILNTLRLKVIRLALNADSYFESHILLVFQFKSNPIYDIYSPISSFEEGMKKSFPNLRLFTTTTNNSAGIPDDAFIKNLSSFNAGYYKEEGYNEGTPLS